MSMTYATSFKAKDLEEFLLDELTKDTGIPIQPFSVIRADMQFFNRTLGITNDNGTLFVSDYEMNAYGAKNNHNNMIRALRVCGAHIDFVH